MTGAANLTKLINPSNVAIIGASNTPTRIGGRALAYMQQRPFSGQLYPVNPSRPTIQGVPAFASVADLPEAPDLAIVALAAKLVPETIEQLGKRGAGSVVIFSSGFAEVDEEGARWQSETAEIARAYDMRIVGPNSLGVLNTRKQLWGTFTSSLENGFPKIGSIGIASQSGAYGAHMLSAAIGRDLGISAFITTGNEADVTTADVISWMVEDEHTEVIVSYFEGIKNGDRLVAALAAAREARKPVFVMKAGRSTLGSAAAQSHTASLAGNDLVIDSVLREFGAIRIESTEQALDFAQTATKRIFPVNNSLGVLSVSGGAGILIADDAERHDLPMPELPAKGQAALKELLSFAATRNPVDCTAQALNDLSLVGKFGITIAEYGSYKSFLIFFSQAGGATSIVPGLRAELKKIRDSAPDCLFILSVLAPPEIVKQYQDDGFVVFEDPARAVAAIAAMGRLGEAFAASKPISDVRGRTQIAAPSHTLNEFQSKALLVEAGIDVAQEQLVTSAAGARDAANALSMPVVMKIVSPDILHKTEIGGVCLNVRSADEAAENFDLLMKRGKDARPDAQLDGILVARQIVGGTECIIGITRDPVFGPVAMFGLGGIYVEVLKDIVLRRCPFDEAAATDMIKSIRAFALLEGARGQKGANLEALARMLSRLSHLAADLGPNLVSIDVNPVIATAEEALAVDAIFEFSKEHNDSHPNGGGGRDEPSNVQTAEIVHSR